MQLLSLKTGNKEGFSDTESWIACPRADAERQEDAGSKVTVKKL